jgi:hypothetical protein
LQACALDIRLIPNTDSVGDPGSASLEGGVMPTAIDRHRVQQLLAEGAQLVEVLPPPEFLDEHLPGAISIPLKELDRERVRELDRDRPVIVYCYDDP